MFRRDIVLPAGTESVWRAITEPGALADWFGARVEWDLRPGGRAHFRPVAEGADREGVIDDVEPGRSLRFRWWPADADGDVSEVAYELEPDEGGTALTVTERRLSVPARSATAPPRPAGAAMGLSGAGRWSPADQVQWEIWARTRTGRIMAVGAR